VPLAQANPSDPASVGRASDVAGDDQALDLAGALVDVGDAAAAEPLLEQEVLRYAE
jgi:hypothetical protein